MKNKKRIYIIAIILSVFILICGTLVGIFVIKYEKRQTQQISELIGQVDYLRAKLEQTTEYYNYETEYSNDSYNYFAIGNSLTLINSWGRGICSTQPNNDYFNLIIRELENCYGSVVAYPVNFSQWERYSNNRDSTLDLLDNYLCDKLDLVTIQLGENVSDTTTYKKDLISLVDYVKEKAPNAKIVIVGDWWSVEKNEIRKSVANETKCLFADLSIIINNTEYQSKTGTICYLSDGTTINVSERASTQPGDKGMIYIADRIIETLKLNE